MPPEFSNPELPDEVNNSDRSPLRSFLVMAFTALLLAAGLAAGLAYFGGKLARYLPYEVEAGLIGPYAAQYPQTGHPVELYLQRLADRLVREMTLPQGMTITVHYIDEPVVNAFATLGGHVAVYRGLLQRMPDENSLAMVVGHEIGHAAQRHPIASLGRGIAYAGAISLVSAGAGSHAAEGVLNNAGMLTLLSFSRGQEEEADDEGLAALVRVYGHAGGATDTFETLRRVAGEKKRGEPPRFLSTHPVTADRVERIAGIVRQKGWQADGRRTPLPEEVRNLVARPEVKGP